MKDLTLQETADSAMGHLLQAMRDVGALEKAFCKADDHEAMIAVSKILRALRVAKELGIEASGKGGIQINGGYT